MKLRYYLRGLGIGLLVASLILTIAGNKNTMSDADVKARAAQLGMVEKETATLAETTSPETEPEETAKEDTKDISAISAEPEETADESKEEEPAEDPVSEETEEPVPAEETPAEPEPAPEEVKPEPAAEEEKPEPTGTPGTPEMIITLVVKSGDSSTSVAKRAADAGLVDSASEFDRFLCANGYDKRICVDSYEISSGASMEEIAKLITKSR